MQKSQMASSKFVLYALNINHVNYGMQPSHVLGPIHCRFCKILAESMEQEISSSLDLLMNSYTLTL